MSGSEYTHLALVMFYASSTVTDIQLWIDLPRPKLNLVIML